MSDANFQSEPFGRAVRREFLRIFGIFAILLGIVATVHLRGELSVDRAARSASEQLNVTLGRAAIARQLDGVISDLTYLRDMAEAQGFLDNGYEAQRRALAASFVRFSRHRGMYDQIRLIDASGIESLRVNRSGGAPASVPRPLLQSKSARYYFRAAYELARGAIYVSPFDLNMEHGRIEDPPKPMLRFATPVFDAGGRKRGVLVLNYLGDSLLRGFRQATAGIADHIALVNREGYWLSSPRPARAWGFMYDNERTFGRAHPGAWAQVMARQEGQVETLHGLLTFASVHPLFLAAPGRALHNREGAAKGSGDRVWKIIALAPRPTLLGNPILARNAPFYLAMLALLAAGSAALAYARVRHARAEDAVEFERRFRGILERLDLLAVGVDAKGRINFCNDAFLRLIGRERLQVMGNDWFTNYVPEVRREKEREAFEQILAGARDPAPVESNILQRDGEPRRVAWNDTLTLDPQERITGVIRIGEDVTEIRAAEQELRKLSRAVDQSPGVVMIVGIDGCIEYVNPRFCELTGYSAQEVIGQNPSLLKSGYTSATEYRRLWETITAGGQWRGVFCNRKKNGDLYWEAASISGVRDGAGKITHYVSVKEDITERRRMEERFQQVVESSPYALVMVNEGGKIVLVNGKTEELFGYPREDLIGQTIEMLIPEGSQTRHAELRGAYANHPVARPMGAGRELLARRRDGSEFPIEVGLSPIESAEGRLVLSAVVDISARKALEAELAERNREVARGQALAVVGRMANMVAHDLRNPLSSIKMTLQMLADDPRHVLDAEELELRGIALESVRYMESIIKDLLSYSREQTLKPVWLEVAELVDAAAAMADKNFAECGVAFDTHLDPGLPHLYGDPDRLRQVLFNLIINAVQASEGIEGRDPRVSVSVSFADPRTPRDLCFEIRDNGHGFDTAQTEHLFDPFYTTRTHGTGLGLAIVKRIVEQHRGSVRLESVTEGGTRAVVVLPIAALCEAATQGADSTPVVSEQQAREPAGL